MDMNTEAKQPPLVGLGCFFGKPGDVSHEEIQACVEHGIDVGYRHLDTAHIYQTEVPVSKAVKAKIKAGVIKREDVFITSKLNYVYYEPEDVAACVKESLQNLDLDYIDLYLIHCPFAVKKPENMMDIWEKPPGPAVNTHHTTLWKILEGFVKEGVIKALGVANFNARQVQEILDMCTIKPMVNQCEIHLYLQNKKLRQYCTERGVTMVAFGPLGQLAPLYRPKEWVSPLTDKVVLELAEKYHKTAAQISLRFFIQQDVRVIPFTTNPNRRIENFQVFDFEIAPEDMQRLQSLDRNHRGSPFDLYKDHKEFPFNDPF